MRTVSVKSLKLKIYINVYIKINTIKLYTYETVMWIILYIYLLTYFYNSRTIIIICYNIQLIDDKNWNFFA